MTFLEFVVRRYLGEPSGHNWTCPFCEHPRHSFAVNQPLEGFSIKYRCYRCLEWGDEFDIVRHFHPECRFPGHRVTVAELRDEWQSVMSARENITSVPPTGTRRASCSQRPRNQLTPADSEFWDSKLSSYAKNFTIEKKIVLLKLLGLPILAYRAMEIGFDPDNNCFVFPEVDGDAMTVGLLRRYPDGTKRVMLGGHRGLSLPRGWREQAGPIYIVEGPTDTLALNHAGLAVIGRPSNTGGTDHLAKLLLGLDRSVVVLGENDQKANGQWPGKLGAETVARKLAGLLGRKISIRFPPRAFKDARAWFTAPERQRIHWEERGHQFVRSLTKGNSNGGR